MIGCVLRNSLRQMSQNSGKGVELKKLTSFLEEFAPSSIAESWDNTGLLVQPVTPQIVDRVLLTNDLTEAVVTEAVNLDIKLIISYHPPIFKPLKKITAECWKERIIGTCLENKIAVYSPHTSLDCVPGGVNDWLASGFDIENITPINQLSECQPTYGAGRICVLKSTIKLSDAVQIVKKLTGLQYIQLALAKDATLDTLIKNIAVCAGSGGSVLRNVNADLYLTGEMSHHDILDAVHNGSNVILCNHSNSERGFLKEFGMKLNSQFGSDVKVFLSKTDKDPLEVV